MYTPNKTGPFSRILRPRNFSTGMTPALKMRWRARVHTHTHIHTQAHTHAQEHTHTYTVARQNGIFLSPRIYII